MLLVFGKKAVFMKQNVPNLDMSLPIEVPLISPESERVISSAPARSFRA